MIKEKAAKFADSAILRAVTPLFIIKSWYGLKVKINRGKLPDFIIVGVMKGGTTSLYKNLRKHPDIEMSPNLFEEYPIGGINRKEAHFFEEEVN